MYTIINATRVNVQSKTDMDLVTVELNATSQFPDWFPEQRPTIQFVAEKGYGQTYFNQMFNLNENTMLDIESALIMEREYGTDTVLVTFNGPPQTKRQGLTYKPTFKFEVTSGYAMTYTKQVFKLTEDLIQYASD